jgi:excisionase family DNA binding protein
MEPLLKTREAAKMLGVSMRTLEGMRRSGEGPKFVRIGNSVRYRPETLTEYSKQCEHSSTFASPA